MIFTKFFIQSIILEKNWFHVFSFYFSIAANSLGGKDEQTDLVISFDSALGTSSGTSRVVTDRVRAATGAYWDYFFNCV